MVQATRRAVIYARVSRQDQDCERQIGDLQAFAKKIGCDVVGVYWRTAVQIE